MKQLIVIPARMKGTRLPGKPLINLNGQPMIKHVWQRCAQVVNKENIYIATEDDVIVDYCESNSIQVVKTGEADSAISRIKLFSDQISADSYINVQGDEPIVNIQDISTVLKYNKQHPDRVVFGKTSCSHEEFNDYSKAKVVCSLSGRLLYSSRAGIPLNNKGKFVKAERAIWIYAFNKNHLDSYYNNSLEFKEPFIEKLEDNEIIRFLEIDVPVYCVDVIGDSWAVDEKKDIEVVEKILRK